MLILGIDPGLNITGIGLIEADDKRRLRIIHTAIVRTSLKDGLSQRLKKIYLGLLEVIKEKKPDVIVLERLYVHHRHWTTAFLLGHARGIVCLVSALENIKLQEYPKTRVDKAVIGRGNASKSQTQMMIKNIFNLNEIPQPEDIADALALAVAHVHISKQSNRLNNMFMGR